VVPESSELLHFFVNLFDDVANMPQLCAVAYDCLEGMWLPTLGHCCLSSIVHIAGNHYLDMININAHSHSLSEQMIVWPGWCFGLLMLCSTP
jgi:hypothetical protein